MFNLYVNSQKLDTYDLSIITNNLLYDVTSPSKRGVTSSNSFIIPKTANNVSILDLFQPDVFDVNYIVDLYDDSSHIVKGNLRIIDIGKKIKVIVVDLLKQFFEDIKKPLYELDLMNDDFTYNFAAYTSLKANTTGLFSFPSYDGRSTGNSRDLYKIDSSERLAHFRPSFNAKKILTEIIEQNGLTADLSKIDIDDLFLLSNASDFLFTSYQDLITGGSLSANTIIPFLSVGSEFSNYINNTMDIIFSAFRLKYPQVSPQMPSLTFGLEIDINEDANLIVKQKARLVPDAIEVERFRINKIAKIKTQTYSTETDDDMDISFYFDKDVTINTIRIYDLNSEVDFYLYPSAHRGVTAGDITDWRVLVNLIPTYAALLEDFKIKGIYNLPNWTQKDFFDEVLKINNLSYDFDGAALSLKYTRGGMAHDITDKIASRAGLGNIGLAQSNYFKFEDDSNTDEIANANYALILDIVNGALEKDLIQLKSSPSLNTINDELASNFELLKVPIYGESTLPNADESDRGVVNERFFTIEAIDDPAGSGATNKCLFDLFFENLYNDNYSQIYDFLSNAKTITYQAKINQFDYIKIKAFGIIYDKVLGRELTVLQINKFNPNRLTEIKAITREVNG